MTILMHFILDDAQTSDASMDIIFVYLFSLAVAALFSTPLWLPVIIPTRFAVFSRAVRWICAVFLVIHVWTFGSLLSHNIALLRSGHEGSVGVVVICAVGVLGSLVAIAALIWPINSVQPTAVRCAASVG